MSALGILIAATPLSALVPPHEKTIFGIAFAEWSRCPLILISP